MANYSVRADLTLGHQKIQPGKRARRPSMRRLDEQSAHAHVAYSLETSSRPSHFQYTHTSPATSTREENLLEGTLPGRIIVLRLLELSWPTKRAEVYIPLYNRHVEIR